MKKLLVLTSVAAVVTSCSTDTGELIGVQDRPAFYQPDPYGTIYIPMGSYNMGPSDEEITNAHTSRSKTVSVQAFYIDDSEISNNEYRQFVYHVRDSIARRRLVEADIEGFAMSEEDYFDGNPLLVGVEEYPEDRKPLNWAEKLDMANTEEDFRVAVDGMYLPPSERLYQRKEIDSRKLLYEYYWLDVRTAARRKNRFIPEKAPDPTDIPVRQGQQYPTGKGTYNVTDQVHDPTANKYNERERKGVDRGVFIIKDIINVYPDTLAWVHDFTYSFNEPLTNMYFWHPAYDEYPVVGVNWKQAKAFCIWRSLLLNNWRSSRGEVIVNDFRLPTESEWEYAARGGHDLSAYPWGGPYIRNSMGCFLGNFKPMRGSYIDDGGFHTVKIYSYNPNDYGLYCMAGNAAEWTSNAFDESAYDFNHDLNPDYLYDAQDSEPTVLKRKVIRGGSWKDIGQYLQTSQRTYEYQDTAKCYIGFRCVMTYLGRSKDDEL